MSQVSHLTSRNTTAPTNQWTLTATVTTCRSPSGSIRLSVQSDIRQALATFAASSLPGCSAKPETLRLPNVRKYMSARRLWAVQGASSAKLNTHWGSPRELHAPCGSIDCTCPIGSLCHTTVACCQFLVFPDAHLRLTQARSLHKSVEERHSVLFRKPN